MAAKSAASINPSDVNLPDPASEPAKTTDGDASTQGGVADDVLQKSVFVNSLPIREEQVQNAVKFLTHPKVRDSPVIHRRNFLERKGLTTEEIDEAFRRVPDPSPVVTSVQTTGSNQGGQLHTSTNILQQAPLNTLQPVSTAPSGVVSTMVRQFHWSHAFLAIGFLAASGAGTAIIFKNAILPRLKTWIRKVAFDQEDDLDKRIASRPSLAEEAAAAAKAAAAAAVDVAKASQEMVINRNEEKRDFKEFMNLLDAQLQEIKKMRNDIHKLEEQTHKTERQPQVEEEYLGGSLTRSKEIRDDRTEFDSRPVRSSSPAASAEPPHPKSYMEIMDMVQRGEKPPNIREINDLPPNPSQRISNPSLAPRSKPWELSQSPNTWSYASRDSRPQFLASGSGSGSGSTFQTSGVSYELNGDSPVPWLQQQQQKNVRITEIESEANGKAAIDLPLQRKWVPPQAPPVSLPEAAIAIRQPKSSAARDRLVDNNDNNASTPLNGIDDELERITKISESGGREVNGGGGSVISSTSEIQEEEQVVA
ncbi:hypothetical protein Dimus_004769 [Dionaea muscipula]